MGHNCSNKNLTELETGNIEYHVKTAIKRQFLCQQSLFLLTNITQFEYNVRIS